MEIVFDEYGFMLDSELCYIAISWPLLIIGAVSLSVLFIYRKFYK